MHNGSFDLATTIISPSLYVTIEGAFRACSPPIENNLHSSCRRPSPPEPSPPRSLTIRARVVMRSYLCLGLLKSVEDQRHLRHLVAASDGIAFIANGSVLPRRSGSDDRPMEVSRGAVPFRGPESLRAVFRLPHRGDVEGMLVPRGVTVIVGGGYHGESKQTAHKRFRVRVLRFGRCCRGPGIVVLEVWYRFHDE